MTDGRCENYNNCKEHQAQVKIEIENIKDSIKEIKADTQKNTDAIVDLKQNNAEMKIYVKQIFEKIDELKLMIQSSKNEIEKTKENVVENVKNDKFTKWVYRIGMKLIDFAIFVGLFYGIGKGLKWF